ncbi:MAG: hypothetical protein GWO41_05320 [candidate division Zixibacteria bacterium]|nr:hypothetical protein [candidate division Zixibacteria bacterium]NIR65585.1 hypothetical protein [candidate division Zixibacteria bacterium]NIS15659.1 hypothetical protein [candidate division Zixibacteria bacterium]NIS47295.1 hypothetical protein [candidate division Zixibacteria bacterium]NIT52167.1 hypothetical protein [candidate division Zixibacteria bacterium]
MPKKKGAAGGDAQQEILEGIDAVGTIVEEDLGYLRKRLSEIQEEISKIRDDIGVIKVDQKGLENNQLDILETLKFLTDKLDRLEIRIAEGLEKGDFDDTIDAD